MTEGMKLAILELAVKTEAMKAEKMTNGRPIHNANIHQTVLDLRDAFDAIDRYNPESKEA